MQETLEYIKQAFDLKAQKCYKQAIEMLYKALEEESDNIEILFQLGELYFLLNNFQRAASYLEKVLVKNEKHIEALKILEKIYMFSNDYTNAYETAEKIFNIEKKYLLPFYSSLFPIGVNCMVIGRGTEDEIAIQLGELVRRTEQKPGEEPIENPELQITAMYFMQKVRSQKELKLTDETKELQEELMAHYQRGRYITAISEDKKMPILNKDDGQVLMPIFTDVQEFLKFQNENRDMKYTMGVVEAARIPEAMGPEVTGVVVNPFGIDLQLNVSRPQK